MSFRLIEQNWEQELDRALGSQSQNIGLICPFIKQKVADRILTSAHCSSMRVITRFNLQDFFDGVSDIDALLAMLRRGVRVRGIRNLHAKLYIFGKSSVLLTSANLTTAALTRNHEFGCVSETQEIIAECRAYFDSKWVWAREAQLEVVEKWRALVAAKQASGKSQTSDSPLPDFGANAPETHTSNDETHGDSLPVRVSDAGRSFVKFSGTSLTRSARTENVFDAVSHSNSHKVLSYPFGKRPRQVRDGDLMFIGRLVREPDDLMIYGRAIGMRHDEQRDSASKDEIAARPWREQWPNYIRVHHAEFIDAQLGQCVSLNGLMSALGHKAFASTLRNYIARAGNTNPRHAFQQQPSVEVTAQGKDWLNDRLQLAMDQHGCLSPARLGEIL